MPTWLNTWQVPRICAGLRHFRARRRRGRPSGCPRSRAKACVGARELGDERALVGRQVGEAAAGQLRHLVDRLEILVRRRADPEAHAASSGEAQDGQRRQARALDQALDDQKFVRAEWIAPPRAPIVSTTGTPQAAILLPSQTPPRRASRSPGRDRRRRCLTSPNSASRSGVDRLGRAAEAAMDVDRTSCSAATAAIASSSSRLRARLMLRRARPHVDAQHGMSGTTLFGPPPSILAGLTVSPARCAAPRAEARGRRPRARALRPSSGLRPAWAERPVDGDREIAAARPRAGERAVGQRARARRSAPPSCPAPPRRSARRSRASRPPRRS